MCSYVLLALYACYWFMSNSMVPFYSPFFAICVGYAGVMFFAPDSWKLFLRLSPSICLPAYLHSGLLLAAPAFISLHLHDLHSGLLLAAPVLHLFPSFVSLCDLHSGPCLHLSSFICLPSFVSLRDLHSGLLLAAPASMSLPSFPRWLKVMGVLTSQ